MTPREQAEQRLAEALMNAYNETVGGKLDEYPDGKHFVRCARIAADAIKVVIQTRHCPECDTEYGGWSNEDDCWDAVCPEEKPAGAEK